MSGLLSREGCETCPWRTLYEEIAANDAMLGLEMEVNVPQANAATITNVKEAIAQIHEGLESARPDCSGWRPRALKCALLLNALVGEGGQEVQQLTAKRACKNPFLRTKDFKDYFDKVTGWGIEQAIKAQKGAP